MRRSRPLSVFIRFLFACHADTCSRRALLSLDDRLLRDIGVTREEAHRAAARPLWRRMALTLAGRAPGTRRNRPARGNASDRRPV